MLALIDADVIIYRVGYTTENDEEWVAIARADESIEKIIADVGATEFQLWLSDSTRNNFRTKVFPEYKANRKQPRPKHYEAIKEHLIKEWGAAITPEQEADDILGIEQTKKVWFRSSGHNFGLACVKAEGAAYIGPPSAPEGTCESVICSIDKDLLQISGYHYNFVKEEKQFVTPEQGLKHFYKQLLTGDSADNIQGCPGIGPAKADKLLGEESTEAGLYTQCLAGYREQYRRKIFNCDTLTEEQEKLVLDQILINGICLKIRTREGEVWTLPTNG